MSKSITCIGSANIDLILKVPRLPRPAETVTGGEFLQVNGGKGANQAVAAARAGGKVSFISCLGEDDYAPRILKALEADGIATERIVRAGGTPTGTALIMIDSFGENLIAVAPGANHRLLPRDIQASRELIAGSRLLVLQMEIPAETTNAVLEMAQDSGVPVIFNYAPADDPSVGVGPAMSVLVVNELEAEALTGRPVSGMADAGEAARELLRRGPGCILLTLGAGGCLLAEPGGTMHVPAPEVEAVDTTAAGDTFCGALAAAWADGALLPEAVRFASAAAALSVTRMGAQPSIPRREEIDRFLTGRT